MRGKYRLTDNQPKTQISDPVPREQALHVDHDVLPERSDDVQKGLRVRIDVLVNPDIAT
jgi:hypothetical protein